MCLFDSCRLGPKASLNFLRNGVPCSRLPPPCNNGPAWVPAYPICVFSSKLLAIGPF
jgi:hypothetical protein